MTTVYISLKRRNNADDEWHTGLLHTEVYNQLGSGWRSKGEVSVHLSHVAVDALFLALHTWRFTRQSKIGIRHCALTKQKHAADINDCD